MKSPLLPLIKITSMTSLEIAELTGKLHKTVLRDIRAIIDELYPDSKIDGTKMYHDKIQGVTISYDDRGMAWCLL